MSIIEKAISAALAQSGIDLQLCMSQMGQFVTHVRTEQARTLQLLEANNLMLRLICTKLEIPQPEGFVSIPATSQLDMKV